MTVIVISRRLLAEHVDGAHAGGDVNNNIKNININNNNDSNSNIAAPSC